MRTNRLIHETSPYLLQHAQNPVDWYAWGPEAFDAARVADKPIFLSVGYSTCYWCHVMERESFENPDIAALMNELFVNIKMDREERPDVDQLYMNAVQVQTQHGGWPMSVFLTPGREYFFGGTYFPPVDSHGRAGFPTLLRAIADAWKNRRDEVLRSSREFTRILSQLAEPAKPADTVTIDHAFIDELIERSLADYDRVNGGFGTAPKFPRQTELELLLTHQRTFPHAGRMKIIRHTLDALANGGLRDHLGGGFHRYSTDAKWLVPHFEIMLYDNAMLAWCYAEAFRQTRFERYATVARGICDFVLREMTSPEGAFYTAFDAEVDAKEGEPYLWTSEQVREVLRDEPEGDITLFLKTYGLDRGPNFADPHHGNGVPDRNVLFLAGDVSLESDSRIVRCREKLLATRHERKQPSLDTKVITSWNALMIRALAFAGDVLHEPRYVQTANRAADHLMSAHRQPDGTVVRSSRDGRVGHPGFLDDYAFLTHALHELKQLDRAKDLAAKMVARFGSDTGGFFFTEASADDLIVRQKTAIDSPLPGGNAIAARCLLALGKPEGARATIALFARQLQQYGPSMASLATAAIAYLSTHDGIVVAPSAGELRDEADKIVKLSMRWTDDRTIAVDLVIEPGWHINANPPNDGMIATRLLAAPDVGELVESTAFPESADAIYHGAVTVVVKLKSSAQSGQTLKLAIEYQACKDNACHAAVRESFEVIVP